MNDVINTTDVSVDDGNIDNTKVDSPSNEPAVENTDTDNKDTTIKEAVNPLTDTKEEKIDVKDENKSESKKEIEKIEYKDFTLPEGLELDNELLDSFKPIAQELNLSQEQAQKLVDMQTEHLQKININSQNEFNRTVEDLKTQTKEMLGSDFEKEMSYAAKSLAQLLPDKKEQIEFKKILEGSGLGNHPLLVKTFINAGKLISEDNFVVGGAASNSKTRLYKNSDMKV